MAAFPAHGNMTIRVDGSLLIADVEGPWNLEFIRYYQTRMQPYIERLSQGGPWGLIIVIHKAALCPPDAVEAIREGASRQAAESGRSCAAYVISSTVEGYGFMDRIWRGIYEGIHPFEIFDSLDAAVQWSHQMLDGSRP